MTTLRVEVGRCCGTTVEDVVAGLRRAGCMKYLEIDPDACQHIPIDELKAALEADGFQVELRPEPPPPPLPWWRRVRFVPRRVWFWLRRVFLRETELDQLTNAMMEAYLPMDRLHAASMRESPILARLAEQQQGLHDDVESFVLHGGSGRAGTTDWHPVCWNCGARFPNGPGQYTATCPECGARWDGSEASDPPLPG